MKKLILVRHAKSSWENSDLSDFERPLNKRGHRDAPMMGRLLHHLGVRPDLIVTSPASRALTTARILADELGYPLENISVREQLYLAGTEEILTVVQGLEDRCNTVVLIGHNPGLTLFCNRTASAEIDNVPTCGTVGISIDAGAWSAVAAGSGSIYMYEYPKKYAI